MKSISLSFIGFLLFMAIPLMSTGQNDNSKPENAYPLCDTSGISFPGGVNVPDAFPGSNGCLDESPNPAWFYFRVDVSGSLVFTISSTPANDIDFIAWGPFTNLNLGDITQYNSQNQIDCSFSGATSEQFDIPGALAGQYYVVLITNYSNNQNSINFVQSGGTGSTDCKLLLGSANSPICEGQPIKLVSTLNPDLYDFQWTGPNGFTSNAPSPEIPNAVPSQSGIYRLIVTDPANKRDTVEVSVLVKPIPPPVITGDTTVCTGKRTRLSVNGGPFSTYAWRSGFLVLGGNQDTLTVGSGIYTVRVTTGNGCFRVSAPFTVKQRPSFTPVITPEGPLHTCYNDSITLGTKESYVKYFWSTSDTTATTRVRGANAFNVTVIDKFGCEGTSVYRDVTQSEPQTEVIGLTTFCEGQTLLLKASGNFNTYSWRVNGQLKSSADTLVYAGGELLLLATDGFGCTDTVKANVTPTAEPQAAFTFNPPSPVKSVLPIQFTDQSTINGGVISKWQWVFSPPGDSSSEQNPEYLFPTTGQKQVMLVVRTNFGCTDTFIVQLLVTNDPSVPNSFSPNGDNINDLFVIPYLDDYPDNTLVIFSRWGKKIFEQTNYKNDWDGGGVPSGTYFYVVSAPNLPQPLKGSFTIFKD